MTCINAKTDTLSVFPKVRFVFSAPLSDTSVSMAFSPPAGGAYTAFLNATRDTLVLDVMEMLEGNTRYALRLEKPVTSINGAVLSASQDSLVFVTYPREHENNGAKDLADTLRSVLFGTISDMWDRDVFLCADKNAAGVFLQSLNSQDSFFIVDSLSHFFSFGRQIKQTDTMVFNDSMAWPIYVFVQSSIKGFEGDYQLGIAHK